jgi:hypothetical protein
MWINNNNIIVIAKSDDIKINNCFVVETDNFYYIIGLNHVPVRQNDYSYEHPIHIIRNFITRQTLKSYFIIDGVVIKDDKGLCNFCSQKFKGFTGTCSFIKNGCEELCKPDANLSPAILMTKGFHIPQKHINREYEPHSKFGFSLEYADFSLTTAMNSEISFLNSTIYREDSETLSEKVDASKILNVIQSFNVVSEIESGWKVGFPLKDASIVITNGKKYKTVGYDDVKLETFSAYGERHNRIINQYLEIVNNTTYKSGIYKFGKVGILLGISCKRHWRWGNDLLWAELKINDIVTTITFQNSQHIKDVLRLTNHEEPDIL